MDDLAEEPVFQRVKSDSASNPADEPVFHSLAPLSVAENFGVGDEPALADAESAKDARDARRAWFARQWNESRTKTRLGVFAGLCVVSGIFAVFCAFLKNSSGLPALSVIIGAPVVEEVGKALGPLMALEKRPWYFGSALSILLVGAVSGFVFAMIENLLYFCCYIAPKDLTPGLFLWRMIVCTAIHVVCATTSCAGLAKAWTHAAREKSAFNINPAIPYFIAAIMLHGVYNLSVVIHHALFNE